MNQEVLDGIRLKSAEEIMAQLAELVHRHRRRYIRKLTRPCPNNCAYATLAGNKVTGCQRCNSSNPEHCRAESLFVTVETKEEVAQQFQQDLRDPNVLRHDYRDVMTLLWVLGQFDGEAPEEPVIASVEKRQAGRKQSDRGPEESKS